MSYVHSERAKEGTRKWLETVIDTLQANILSLEVDIGDAENFFQKRGIQRNLDTRKKQYQYFKNLWEEYKRRGLI